MKTQLQTVRSRFPQSEYQLIRDSFPRELRGLSPARLKLRIQRCEKLIEGYKSRLFSQTSSIHFWKKSGGLGSERLIRYRLGYLESVLKKFRSEMKKNSLQQIDIQMKSNSRRLTEQPKRKISRRGSKSGAMQNRDNQRRQSAQENSVNPSSRTR